jgi:uncharacterized protein (DUF1697 family)
MRTHVALLRGINVGGKNALPMGELRSALVGLGCESVKTVLQSGNAVFRSAAGGPRQLGDAIRDAVEERCGIAPEVLVLPPARLREALRENPFSEAMPEPERLHVGFLVAKPRRPDAEGLESLRCGRERFALGERFFYLHAPDGIARSRLAAGAEALIGVPMTLRNARTVARLEEAAQNL